MVNAIKNDRKYTYEDYLTWNDGKRWEIIDGVAYLMSTSPSNVHQEVLSNLNREFAITLKERNAKFTLPLLMCDCQKKKKRQKPRPLLSSQI